MAEEKKITIRELQTFIEAVEFAADSDNWIPSERQWKRIRSMIDNLVDTTPTRVAAPQPAPVYEQPRMPAPDRPVMMAPPGLGQRPPSSGAPAPILAGAGQGMVKTPDIDTSTGPYNSDFA